MSSVVFGLFLAINVFQVHSSPGDYWDFPDYNYNSFYNCYAPPRITNGFYAPLTYYSQSSVVTYQCNPGYRPVGHTTITCGYSGWVGSPPRCTSVDPCHIKQCPYGTKCEASGYTAAVCKPTNPCASNPCASRQHTYCHRTASSYECRCKSGYHKNTQHHCVVRNPCDNKPCGYKPHTTCKQKGVSGYDCVCNAGYTEQGTKCVELHPCALLFCGEGTKCVVNEYKKGVCKPICGENQVFTQCASHCPENCNSTPGPCITSCKVDKKCECKPGFVERSETDPTCIRKALCPPKCGPNQVPTTCASNCPPNCDSIKSKKPIPCILSCKVEAKCECAPGYVQRSALDPTCILKSECPVDPCYDHHCDVNAKCVPLQGELYSCVCNTGYKKVNGKCKKMVCYNHHCGPNSKCVPVDDELYQCVCDPGYSKIKGVCKKIPCYQHKCHDDAKCVDKDDGTGNYDCICNVGYDGDGFNCRRIFPCENPLCSEYAICKDISYTEYTCTCKEGWKGDGKSCEKIKCKPPMFPYVQYTPVQEFYTFKDVITITCTIGYELGPGQIVKRTCSADGEFKPDISIACQDVDECLTDPCHENAICEDTMGSFTCTCMDGYIGDGINECYVPTCKVPRPLINGVILPTDVPSVPQGDAITFMCRPGYMLTGAAKRLCMGRNVYKPQGSNSCVDIDECLTDPCHENAICTNLPGSYKCKCMDGYKGDGKIKCYVPKCVVPRPLTHGFIQPMGVPTVLVGSSITYNCKVGFQLVGAKVRRCQSENMFMPSGASTCQDINECLDGSHNCHTYAKCVNTIGSFKCTCKMGYTGNGVNCAGVCGKPEVPDNGKVVPMQTVYKEGAKITYTCDNGYVLIGKDEYRMCKMQKWTGTVPVCQPTCLPQSLPDGMIALPEKPIYNLNNRVKYQCAMGYKLYGEEYSTCIGLNMWSHQPSKCKPATCSPPVVPANVMIVPSQMSYKVMSVVVFQCKVGYVLKGSTGTKCGIDLQWTAYVVTCIKIQCPAPLPLPNGRYDAPNGPMEYYPPGTKMMAMCKPGYEMKGRYITCGEDGEWMGSVTCHAGSCKGICGAYRPASSNKCRCGVNCRYKCCPDYQQECGGGYAPGYLP